MPFMIAHGASVVIVRDGKRKKINANTGADFTEEEIASVNANAPGSLRKPVNEGFGESAATEGSDEKPKKGGKKPKAETEGAKSKAKKPEDEDDDEDI